MARRVLSCAAAVVALAWGCDAANTADGPGPGAASGGSVTTGGFSGGSLTGGAPSNGGAPGAGGHFEQPSGSAAAVGGHPDADGNGGSSGAANGTSGGSGGDLPAWSESFPTFVRHEIAKFDSGYATATADVDGDGKLDVIGLSSGAAGMVWFKNPAWQKFTITTKTQKLIHLAPYDVDADGDIDIAVASAFDMNNTDSGGAVGWLEAPDDPTSVEEWILHPIDTVPTSHRLRWGDIDGDGKKELLNLPIFGRGSSAPAHKGPVELNAYSIPQDLSGTWARRTLSDSLLEVAHGVTVVDWDGDAAEDILTAANDGVDLFRTSQGETPTHIGDGSSGTAPDRGSSEVGLGTLGASRFVATIEPWHGTDAVIYTPASDASAPWQRSVLGKDFEHGHALLVADLNGDGFDEIVGGGGQGAMAELIYRYVPSTQSWTKIELDMGTVAVSGMDLGDFNGDGALDLVAIGGSPTNNLVWYENASQ